ncbi:TerD family protein [Cellulomonas rhizosphaerae]|uniref:TerD family protein n=1 Tax=Cellulomonas rhizosphaerae TaxID=2293719 RepID=A0A413RNQ4_9CELL|nr:TerD family protein [Cellulomonas rhizosphaerae]RHA43649.1 TerD family protein [Cellulomonas rhizosphaerae]
MDEVVLSKGANCGLPDGVSRLQIVIGWGDADGDVDVDAAALMLDDSGRVGSDENFVFFNQPASPDGAVSLLGRSSDDNGSHEIIAVDLDGLSPEVGRVVVTASLAERTFGGLDGLICRVLDEAGAAVARYEITDATTETAFVFCEVYRRGEAWKVRAVGQGWDSGLAGLATDFGVAVDDAEAPEAEPGEPAPLSVADDTIEAVETRPDDSTIDEPTTATVIDFPAPALVAVPSESAAPARRRSAGVRTSKRATARVQAPRLQLAGAEGWQAARLFSVSGVGVGEEQEKRATSALLSTMMAVPAFGRALTSRFGAPAGGVETYLEVPFALRDGTVYPDGVLRVARGSKRWTGLIEVKTGSGQLHREQVEKYLDVARQEGFDTLVTLSNDIAPQPGEHPVGVDRRKLRRTSLIHLSWAEVLHEAKFTLQHRGVADSLQAWILSELISYLEHPRSGAADFHDMGPSWVPVREAIHAGTLRPSDGKVPAVANSWTRLVRQICLRLSSELGVSVTQAVPRKLAADSVARVQAIVARLAAEGVLDAVLKIPLAVGPLTVTADLRTSQVRVAVAVTAPREGTGQKRLGWLLRQLRDAPDDLVVETLFAGRTESTSEKLVDVRANANTLLPDRGAEVVEFRLSLTSPMGTKRSGGRGAFVPSVVSAVELFYSTVVQPLKAWQPPAPKLSDDVTAGALAEQDDLDEEAVGRESS